MERKKDMRKGGIRQEDEGAEVKGIIVRLLDRLLQELQSVLSDKPRGRLRVPVEAVAAVAPQPWHPCLEQNQ
jgi:hypothetical protein